MYIDLYKDQLHPAELFGKQVLYSEQPIAREEVPDGWHCYDLCGTDRNPDQAMKLVDSAVVYRTGTILSPLPLKKPGTVERKVKDLYVAYNEQVTLAEFCQDRGLPIPQDPRKYILCPASPEEAGLFFAQTPEKDEELGAIGHVRMDFGSDGRSFYHSWWPRGPKELNRPEFKAELQEVVNELRKTVLKSLGSMRRYCWGHGGEIRGGSLCQNYGFTVETERYLYRLRCNPAEGDYHAYLNCFDKQVQQMGLEEKERQMLPVVGRVTFADGDCWDFTDPEKYLKTVREELPYQATTGFRCETLTDDPAIRKAVDDMVCNLYGEENPCALEEYKTAPDQGMTLGGM